MVDIIHRVGMKGAALDDVYAAVATVDGLAGWWTADTTGRPRSVACWSSGSSRVASTWSCSTRSPGRSVLWEVVDGPPEWIGTTVRWELKQEGEYVIVLFAHEGWKEQVEFMSHCSTKWATFLMSLKQLVETGTGAPAPADVQISDWH